MQAINNMYIFYSGFACGMIFLAVVQFFLWACGKDK